MLFGKWHCELVGLHHTWVSHGSTNNYKRDIVGISKWDEQTRLTLGTNKGLLESSQPTTGDFFRFSRPRAGWGLRASCSMKIPLRLCESGWSVYTVYILYIYIGDMLGRVGWRHPIFSWHLLVGECCKGLSILASCFWELSGERALNHNQNELRVYNDVQHHDKPAKSVLTDDNHEVCIYI